MNTIIDLTQTVEDLMPVYPGDDDARLLQTKHLLVDKYNNFNLHTGMHVGTHIDGPMHLTDSETYICELPLENFIGNGCLIDARGQDEIIYKIEYEETVKEKDMVLIYTGYDDKFGLDEYFKNHPVMSEDLAQLFIRKHIKVIGIDCPSPDNYPFPIHKILLNNNIFIIENLTNLNKLVGKTSFEVIAMPLKLKADSSILRVAARITE